MARTFPELPWCRYADDGLVHCRVEHEAERVKAALQARLAECHLEMHPTKTRIVYCKDGKRKGEYPNIKFDFLGYCFRPRLARNSRDNSLFCRFTPAVSPSALKSMRAKIRELRFRRRTELSLAKIAHASIRYCAGGSTTTGDTHHRRSHPCSDTSIRRYWLGRGASSNALKPIRSARAAFCRSCRGEARISSCIGNLA